MEEGKPPFLPTPEGGGFWAEGLVKDERSRKNEDKERLDRLAALRIRPCRITIERGLELL